ncbi:unnamed protein product [Leptidea sinapis]|uniref:Major facilitator superfamily (MFS) profile domain-containing protein n=1 Tax=Leptidea sinapis TaxID=189913 RepID=A0A5E4QDN8_9NEOP|nr:unnamed protein product [Leptidea sinapis]
MGFVWIVSLRVALGFFLGATWPAILPMASKWIPAMDRSKFMSNMMASSLGAAITMPICGFLIAHFGWESAFYFTGLMMIAQAFFGHDRVWSIAIFTMALTINGAVTAGYLGNGLDIAPRFSGN